MPTRRQQSFEGLGVFYLGRSYSLDRGVPAEGLILYDAKENVATLRQQLADLEAEVQAEIQTAAGVADPLTDPLDAVVVKPKRTGVTVQAVGLAWVPV
jgi:hypothetical protein